MKRFLSALLGLLLSLSLCVSALADKAESPYDSYKPRTLEKGETLHRGIDVSQFQEKIDWKKVADNGVEFAIIRVGLRGWGKEGRLLEDTRFKQNLREAHENGILVGAYIYSQAITPEEAREEARYLVSRVKGYHIDLPLVLDQEFVDRDGTLYGRLFEAELSKDEMTDICNAFCAEVEHLGYQSMVYSNPYMLSTYLHREELGRLWLANYVEQTEYAGSYEYWQCGIGRLPGITTDVDLDFWFAGAAAPKPAMRFTDVSSEHWSYSDLVYAVWNGWIYGYPDLTFRPDATLTRADFVTMLSRLSGDDLQQYTKSPFPDVPADEYYCASVAWAVDIGVIDGFPDGKFHPTENVTREQMAHIMTLYLKHIEIETGVIAPEIDREISDLSQIGSWALNDVLFCYSVGLLNGRASGFEPAGTATRAESATVLARLDRYIAKITDVPEPEPTEPAEPTEPTEPAEPGESPVPTEPDPSPLPAESDPPVESPEPTDLILFSLSDSAN